MIGDITKAFDFSILVSPDSLRAIDKFISSKYETRKYTVVTADGVSFSAKEIEEVLAYTNPRARRITKIEISGTNGEWWRDKPSIYFSLSDASVFRNSVIYTLKNESEKDLDFSVKKLEELVFPMKTSYSWMYNRKFNLVLEILSAVLFMLSFLLLQKDSVTEVKKHVAECLVFGVISFWSVRWLICKFYPKSVFLIGHQVQWYEKKEKWRTFIFEKTIWALILSFLVAFLKMIFGGTF